MRVKWRFSSTLMHLIKWLWEFYEIWVTRFVQLPCTRSNEHERCMRVKWRFSLTLMHLIKRLWEFSEIWVTRFVQLACTRSNEHESCTRVELPDLSNSHVLGQTSMKIVWELSDQFCSALMHSVKRAWNLYESWVTSFVQLALMHFVKRAWQLYESKVLFNSHALGQMSMRVVWELSDQFFFNSYGLGQTSTRVVWNWVTSFVQFLCTRSNERKSCMRVEWWFSSALMHLINWPWEL